LRKITQKNVIQVPRAAQAANKVAAPEFIRGEESFSAPEKAAPLKDAL
jgi:hypothetical protein